MDTCTLSPLFRFDSDASGTLNSTVSPPCIFSLTVFCWWFTSATVALRVSCPSAPVCDGCVPMRSCVPVLGALGAVPGEVAWANTKGAAANTTAMANTTALLNVLDMWVFSSTHTSFPYLPMPPADPVPVGPVPDGPGDPAP